MKVKDFDIVRIDKEVHKRIGLLAKSLGVTQTMLVKRIVEMGLDGLEREGVLVLKIESHPTELEGEQS